MMFALRPTLITLFFFHTLFTVVFSATVTIRVGDGGNRFVPNTVSVQVGDIVDGKEVTKQELKQLSNDPGLFYRDEDGRLRKTRSFKTFFENF